MSAPHLRQVLAAAAVGAGLTLRDGPAEAITAAEARATAAEWGLRGADDAADPDGVVVVLVDGLGLCQLQERRGHAPTLRAWLADAAPAPGGGSAHTCVPSTTAAALTTLGTGALPGATGMVGYCVLNPRLGRDLPTDTTPDATQNLCLITWEGRAPDPRRWQDVPTIFERISSPPDAAADQTPPAVTIGPARFAGSGLTEAALRGAHHLGADRVEDRPGLAADALRRGVPLVYLYVGELDHAGHRHGWRSKHWLEQLERLDAAMAELLRRVPAGTRVLLTADHGMVDTDPAHRIDLTEYPELARDVVAVAGEPRFSQLYVPHSDPEAAAAVAARWREVLGERALWVGTRAQAAARIGPIGARADSVLGDVLVAMADNWVVVDPRVHSAGAIAMPGVHGSLTDAEMTVPLLAARA
ncbi:alkaline phosphatase family protein [Actinomyces ruminicola]|uniref:Predicted pyrophosphatase or phosphodiesterase, AlkP superfamily n=1 Tax=Actinomyces ruminicola TaxID=332524 RepID=A0A1G9U947_9ACTO|nr:alkaline phosphatase family protein [Actinomyces ruminicola]SDM56459.1 Predicted pyrophosphatase or phosphodiesterase, AlkP superfamily [Actinomyces ruminicola]